MSGEKVLSHTRGWDQQKRDEYTDYVNRAENPFSKQGIQYGDVLILKAKRGEDRFVKLHPKNRIKLFRCWINPDSIIGKPYGSVFELSANGEATFVKDAFDEDMTAFKDASFMPTNNNKEIIPTASFNALTREDIEKLKKEKTSEELIKIMSESNSSWQKKTEYSREKYINQKKRKYEKTFTVVKPTIEIASDIHYTKLNLKMLNLRTDTLAQILSFANIRAGGQVIVVEECHQVLLQAVATRMGGYGRILTGFAERKYGMLDMMSKFGLSTAIKETISPFPLAWVNEIASTMVDACVPKADLPALEWKPRKVKMNNNLARKMKRKQEKQEAEAAAAAGCVTGGETTNKTGGNSNESASSPSAMDTDAQSQAETPTESPARETQSEKPSVEAETEAETQKGRGKGKGKGKKKYTNTIDNDSNPALVNRKVNPLPASYVEPEKTELLPRQLTNDSTKQCLRNGSESLIIAVSWDAEKTLDALWPLLLPSGSFVVFSQYLAPLNKLHARLKNKKQAVFLQCSETWYRVQQVLPNRTHPMMNMDGGSGYILTGIKVDDTPDVRPMSARFVTHTGNKRRAKKRRRK